jgi:hypothetical protein
VSAAFMMPPLLWRCGSQAMGRPRLVPTGCTEHVELAKPMVRTRLSREELAPSPNLSVALAQSNLPDEPLARSRAGRVERSPIAGEAADLSHEHVLPGETSPSRLVYA